MNDPEIGTATVELLRAAARGEAGAVDRLFTQAYDELRGVAGRLRRRNPHGTLDTTALLHEGWLKLSGGQSVSATDRAHFIAIVARAMRQVLVDAARRRLAGKRGGGAPLVTFDDSGAEAAFEPEQYLALEQALTELEAAEPRRARVVECRFIGGLSVEETATVLGVSTPTVKRDWRVARAWLADALRP
jgi:RNA polymerase sigma factor (TIGR02999 family)